MAGRVVTNLEIRGRVHRACSYRGDPERDESENNHLKE